jgi:hypothetical protein
MPVMILKNHFKKVMTYETQKMFCSYRVMSWNLKNQINFKYVLNLSKNLNQNVIYFQLINILLTDIIKINRQN